jgi:two-component system OmpR family response regulator
MTMPEPRSPLIYVVDDEEHITELLAMGLGINGFTVERFHDGRQALTAIEGRRPDLAILDVMMPGLTGTEVLERIRRDEGAGSHLPVLLLTARDETKDKVEGLRLGSDDYVTKPFSIEELIERVKAILRRSGNLQSTRTVLQYDDLTMDEETREVTRAGRAIDLTPTEFRLLHFLLENARRVMTREQILLNVWDYDFGGNASVLETYISYLRQKVDAEGPPLLQTVRGIGYSLRHAS